MFTSRAEFRLSLREDNADLRLRPYGRALGLINQEDDARFSARERLLDEWKTFLRRKHVRYGESSPSLAQLLKRPELGLDEVVRIAEGMALPGPLDPETAETLEIELKYEGYIEIQREEIERLNKMRELTIPAALDYRGVAGLSNELREKLTRQQPKSLAEAARISGMTPAALTALLFHLRQKGEAHAHSPV
jgi:tRNA uridine 5-carboxymethylaminomethyl modification enzyme